MNTPLRRSGIWHAFSRDLTVLPASHHTFRIAIIIIIIIIRQFLRRRSMECNSKAPEFEMNGKEKKTIHQKSELLVASLETLQ